VTGFGPLYGGREARNRTPKTGKGQNMNRNLTQNSSPRTIRGMGNVFSTIDCEKPGSPYAQKERKNFLVYYRSGKGGKQGTEEMGVYSVKNRLGSTD